VKNKPITWCFKFGACELKKEKNWSNYSLNTGATVRNRSTRFVQFFALELVNINTFRLRLLSYAGVLMKQPAW
jgi:hypothetical protein